MLYRFMKSAGAVAIGLAVLLGWSAHAQVDLTPAAGTTVTVPTFALETLPAAGSTGLHALPDVGIAADVTFRMPKATNGSHLRIELTGGKFDGAFAAADISGGCTEPAVAFGGEVGSDYVIVECTTTTRGDTSDTPVTLNDIVALNKGAMSISVTIGQWFDFERALLKDATVGAFKFGKDVTGTFVRTGSLASGKVEMPMMTTASVAEDFQKFKAGGGQTSDTVAMLAGNIQTMLTDGLRSGAGFDTPSQGAGLDIDETNAANAALAFASTTVTLTEENGEDLSFGTFFLAQDDPNTGTDDAPVDEKATCGGTAAPARTNFVNATPHATGTVVATVSASALLNASLCVELTPRVPAGSPEGTEAVQAMVPSSTFNAVISFAAPAAAITGVTSGTGTAGYKPGNADGAAGMLKRDGTVVHIPFLTVAEGYNHRLIIVNRNSFAAKYTVTFTDEDGGMSTASDMATGYVPMMETKTLRTTDLVSIEGRSRTAATVTVVSLPSKVDVQTTLRNNGTGTYDSVLYMAVEN